MDLSFLKDLISQNLPKYPELQNTCSGIHIDERDFDDESHILTIWVVWDYPDKNWDTELNDTIADQSNLLFWDIVNAIKEHWPEYQKVYQGSNLKVPDENKEHLILADGGDIIAVHCNDNSMFIIATFSGQW